MPGVAVYTLGCKVSQYESEAVAERLAELGLDVVSPRSVADAYIINTCTVTAESDRKCRQVVRRLKAKNPGAVIAVMGCYSQRAPEELLKLGVDIILGTAGKLAVAELVKAKLECRGEPLVSVGSLEGAEFEPMCVRGTPRTRAYVKIEDGCEAKCTYCAISAARGPVRSKPKDEVIREVRGLAEVGVKEVVLTGIETGSYGRDFNTGYTLADLIAELSESGYVERIRLGSLAPELCGREFAERLRGVAAMTPHFHLSMQSGSDKILRAMKRRYNRDMALRNIDALREAVPGAMFTTDLMVGFPGETEDDFLDTVDFVRRVGFIACHVFAYSRRAGTPAAEYPDQVPEEIKRDRSARLISVAREVRDSVLSRAVDERRELSVILETYADGVYIGHSDEFFEVAIPLPAGLEGRYVRVMPKSHSNGVIHAEYLGDIE